MNFTLELLDWQALAPGLSTQEEWQTWAREAQEIDPQAPLAKPQHLPMITARRLNSGSRLAADCGLALLQRQAIDAVLFTSRHGELERNYRILQALATQQPVSPTDFALSVHNAAVGNLTIVAKQPLVSASLAAGQDSFQQGLLEVLCLLQAGYKRVLMVDFDGRLPDFYHPILPPEVTPWPFALGLVFQAGRRLHCQHQPNAQPTLRRLPQSLQFLQGWLSQAPTFPVQGEASQWLWSRP